MSTKNRYDGIIDNYLETNHQLELHQFMTMISINHDERKVLELVKEFCMQSTSDLDHRLALEIFYVNGCTKELQYFIEKNRTSDNLLNQKYAIYYELMTDIKCNKNKQMIRDIAQLLPTDSVELRCLKYFIKMDIDICLHLYDRIGYYLNKLQPLLQDIDNPLLASSFNIRTHQFLFMYYWKRNELILARRNAYIVLQHPNHIRQKATLHIYLAFTYIYEDFASAIYHIEEARNIVKTIQDKDIDRFISSYAYPFICAHFGEVDGVETDDPVEKAHIEIARGNQRTAKAILERLPTSTPFTKYYLGLVTNKQQYLIRSYQDFMNKQGDHFFAKLPLHACEMIGI
ncbi:AimR family lysis-lysogeny pheromone receptor [Gracilibacillus xinjiangensis]|uniref:AimR family lysis-lysogeny pheromone receptor n=1 Tax=Gracilibacillus xinjiangensis TaxID=1193282 RepID=A0ABV8WWZ6_9BACI